jgi:outer membrane putative beta-barrel porin/alpha-amylase
MLKRILIGSAVYLLFILAHVNAQGICPLGGVSSSKLVCVIPQTFGPWGLGAGQGAPLLFNGHQGHFESDFLSSFGPINEAVGIQVSQLPIASPSSGITFSYDPVLKTFAPSTEQGLGSIIGESARTIGHNKLYVAFSFQYFDFQTIDGQPLNQLPAVFQHQPVTLDPSKHIVPCPNQSGLTGVFANQPCFVRDYIQTVNSIDLRVHQYTVYVTYGVTRHFDVSAVIPLLSVSIGSSSNATIVPNSVAPTSAFPSGVFHQFDPSVVSSCGSVTPCLNGKFADSGSASGIGDVTVRGKYEVYQGEHWGVAAGVDVRLPTGDESNFLGSGATGVKPFGIVSYQGRISPHVVLGYEWNGNSILAGNFVATNTTKGSLPNRFIYTIGADASVNKRLTAAIDLYGQRLFGVPQLYFNPYTDLGKCSDINCTTLTPGTSHADLGVRNSVDYSIVNLSFGLKYRLVHGLVLTANILAKLDDNGLRSPAVPLVGASYTF